MTFFHGGRDDEDVAAYIPTPIGGGFDLAHTFGCTLPPPPAPSVALCFPLSSAGTINIDHPYNSSGTRPTTYGSVSTVADGYDRHLLGPQTAYDIHPKQTTTSVEFGGRPQLQPEYGGGTGTGGSTGLGGRPARDGEEEGHGSGIGRLSNKVFGPGSGTSTETVDFGIGHVARPAGTSPCLRHVASFGAPGSGGGLLPGSGGGEPGLDGVLLLASVLGSIGHRRRVCG